MNWYSKAADGTSAVERLTEAPESTARMHSLRTATACYITMRNRRELVKVRVQTERSFNYGSAELLFGRSYLESSTTATRAYNIDPTGERFLMIVGY